MKVSKYCVVLVAILCRVPGNSQIGLPAIQLPAISFKTLIANLPPCVSGPGCTILPATVLQFTALRQSNQTVALHWKTKHEHNLAGYGVERSLGNATQFGPVTFVPAQAGATITKEYRLPDANNFPGISYYRLRQTDIDGKYVYSDVVAVKGYREAQSLLLYPNPARAQVQLTVVCNQAGKGTVQILTVEGKGLLLQAANWQPGTNRQTVAVGSLPSGVYQVKIITPSGEVLLSKLVKE